MGAERAALESSTVAADERNVLLVSRHRCSDDGDKTLLRAAANGRRS